MFKSHKLTYKSNKSLHLSVILLVYEDQYKKINIHLFLSTGS